MQRTIASIALVVAGCVYENPAWLGASAGGDTTGSTDDGTGDAGPTIGCDPLLPVPTDAIAVSPGDDLDAVLATAWPGATIALAAGTYPRTRTLRIDAAGVTLRGADGDASTVVLRGTSDLTTLVEVHAADVTIADLTLDTAGAHLVAFSPTPAGFTGGRVIRSVLRDAGSAHVVVENVSDPAPAYVDGGELACSEFTVRDAFRAARTACQLEGVRARAARGWHVHDNSFRGFFCLDASLSSTAIHFSDGARDTVVERNVVADSYRGIGFGNDYGAAGDVEARHYDDDPCTPGVFKGHIGGVVRNNMIWIGDSRVATGEGGTSADSMIYLWWACETDVYHNTIVTLVPSFHDIEYRYERTSVRVGNNITHGDIAARDGAVVQLLDTNLQMTGLSAFVDPLAGDLHLAPGSDGATLAVDRGLPITDDPIPTDFDGEPRDAMPDIGADELVAP